MLCVYTYINAHTGYLSDVEHEKINVSSKENLTLVTVPT